jgi:hypothetical protein
MFPLILPLILPLIFPLFQVSETRRGRVEEISGGLVTLSVWPPAARQALTAAIKEAACREEAMEAKEEERREAARRGEEEEEEEEEEMDYHQVARVRFFTLSGAEFFHFRVRIFHLWAWSFLFRVRVFHF